MKKNEIINLKIENMTLEGSGIAHTDGMVVFVPSAAVGDEVEAVIIKAKKSYAVAKILKVLTSSPERTESDCPVSVQCGGCSLRHISYDNELNLKALTVKENIKRIGGLEPHFSEILFDNESGYRNKAQYPVAEKDGHIFAGFYAARSHRVVNSENCALSPQIFGKIAKEVCLFAEENNVKVYNEETGKGLLRHIYIRRAEVTGQIMVCLVLKETKIPNSDELIKRLLKLTENKLFSFVINVNRERTNVILGTKCICLYGKPYIEDVLCSVNVRISPLSFYQVNHTMAEKLYNRAAEYAEPDNKTILDLYCGAGTIGLSMAKSAKQIIGVEVVEEAVRDAKINAERNGIENVRFICADAADAAKTLAKERIKPDIVIVDPPRKGCEKEVLDIISENFAPYRIVYVSCDSATLSRDAQILSEKGYNLLDVTPADLFARTSHCEAVSLFERVKE